jgi:hypothetical protein
MQAPHRVLASLSLAVIMGLLLTTTSCTTYGINLNSSPSSGGSNSSHSYNGTASVGDFYTLTEDDTANTVTYTDVTNSLTGTVPFTTTDHIHYTFTDPTHNLIKGVAVPGYAMILESQKSGPTSSTPALITAVQSGPITLASLLGSYNLMQFRTTNGGLAIGSVTLTSSALSISGYSPYGATTGSANGYNNVSQPASGIVEGPTGTYLTTPAPNPSTAFGTAGPNATFIVDVDFGSVLGLQKAASAAFQSASAGTYVGVAYGKTGATSNGPTETGTGVFTDVALNISSGGVVTLTNPATDAIISTGTLIPVSNVSYIFNGTANEVTDPCFGLFTYRTTTATSQTDVFVSFGLGGSGSAAFAMFTSALPLNGSSPYNYLYGVAVP